MQRIVRAMMVVFILIALAGWFLAGIIWANWEMVKEWAKNKGGKRCVNSLCLIL